MLFLLLVAGFAPTLLATPGEDPLDRFLAHDARQPHYRGTRHLEAENGKRRGWLAIGTEYAPDTGFRYHITAEGGSDYIRKKVLKAVLDGERAVVAAGEDTRSSLARINYNFQTKGIEDDGLAHVLLVPRRKERALVAGVMLLRPDQGGARACRRPPRQEPVILGQERRHRSDVRAHRRCCRPCRHGFEGPHPVLRFGDVSNDVQLRGDQWATGRVRIES